jgi:hypothetical protein
MGSRHLLIVLVVAAVAALLFLARPRSEPGVSEAEPDVSLARELEQLSRSQNRTAEALERLERLLSRGLDARPSSTDARREVAAGPEPQSLEGLIASLDALRASIETESRRTQELIRSAPAFGGESLSELRQRRTVTDWTTLEGLEQSWRADPDLASRSQYLQTARDLLESYGPPTAIYRPKGGMLFHYRRHAEGAAGPSWYFRLQDGLVVEFFVEDDVVE